MAYCTPSYSGVPGATDPFDWWTDPADPSKLRFSPDNPNWVGALNLSEGAGANRDLTFRALKGSVGGTSYLFLSWVVRTSALSITGNDRLNVLLGDGASYAAFQVKLNTASSTWVGTQNAGTFTYRIHDCTVDATGAISQVNPGTSDGADIEGTGRMWVDVASPGRGLQTRWAFQVAIPLGVSWAPTPLSLPASGAFKLWYEVWASLPNATVPYQVPDMPADLHTTNQLQVIPSGLNLDNLLDLATGGTCDSAVTISYSNVGVRNVAASDPARPSQYSIRLDLGKPYPPNNAPYDTGYTPNVSSSQFQNQFFAIPTFPGSYQQAQREAVRARFSLANWGSQYSIPTASSWRPVPGGEDVQYQDAVSEARFIWPLPSTGGTPDQYTTTLVRNINTFLNAQAANAPYPADAQNPHQCMLVELTSTDPSVVLSRSSIYVNMNVTRTSTVRAPARISIEGLPPIGPGRRDVYLYLQTFNMPQVVKGESAGPVETIPRNSFEHGSFQEGPVDFEVEDVAVTAPTYIVHVYHDTGDTYEMEDGSTIPIVRGQTAFGYFAVHEGNLVGWETRLYGAEKLAENFYRLRIPNDGAEYVETAIQARESSAEPPLPPDGIASTSCEGIAAWLDSFGVVGRLLARLVRLLCSAMGDLWWVGALAILALVLVVLWLWLAV